FFLLASSSLLLAPSSSPLLLAPCSLLLYSSPGADPRPTSTAFPQQRPSLRQRGEYSRIGKTNFVLADDAAGGFRPRLLRRRALCRSKRTASVSSVPVCRRPARPTPPRAFNCSKKSNPLPTMQKSQA